MSILINPIKHWVGMSHTRAPLKSRRPRRSTPSQERPLLATPLAPPLLPLRERPPVFAADGLTSTDGLPTYCSSTSPPDVTGGGNGEESPRWLGLGQGDRAALI
jgi:hypothetical protein